MTRVFGACVLGPEVLIKPPSHCSCSTHLAISSDVTRCLLDLFSGWDLTDQLSGRARSKADNGREAVGQAAEVGAA